MHNMQNKYAQYAKKMPKKCTICKRYAQHAKICKKTGAGLTNMQQVQYAEYAKTKYAKYM